MPFHSLKDRLTAHFTNATTSSPQEERKTLYVNKRNAYDRFIPYTLQWTQTTDPRTGKSTLVAGSVRYLNDDNAELMEWCDEAGMEWRSAGGVLTHVYLALENLGNEAATIKAHPDLLKKATEALWTELKKRVGEAGAASLDTRPELTEYSDEGDASMLESLKRLLGKNDESKKILWDSAITALHGLSADDTEAAYRSAGWTMPSAQDVMRWRETLASMKTMQVEDLFIEQLLGLGTDVTAGAQAIALWATCDPSITMGKYGETEV